MLTLSDEAAYELEAQVKCLNEGYTTYALFFSPIRQKDTKFQNEDGMCPPQRIWVILVLFPFDQVILALFLMRVVPVQ